MLEVLDKIGTTLIPTPVLGPYLVTTQVDLVHTVVLRSLEIRQFVGQLWILVDFLDGFERLKILKT